MNWTYEQFKQAILGLTDIDLSSYKERQMKRRIDSLISRNGCNSYQEYYALIKSDKEKLLQFIDYITINVSEFYRNPAQWETLEKEILPSILDKYKNNIKIWSAACSTGEEPYSVVMLLSKFLPLSSIRVLATDIDNEAINKAKEGVYAENSIRSLPKEFLLDYFTRRNNLYILDPRIKACVEFGPRSAQDPFPDNCHLILCRNVIIYFTEEAKAKLYHKFHDALHTDGVLFVGSTEQIIMPLRYNLKPVCAFFYIRIY